MDYLSSRFAQSEKKIVYIETVKPYQMNIHASIWCVPIPNNKLEQLYNSFKSKLIPTNEIYSKVFDRKDRDNILREDRKSVV